MKCENIDGQCGKSWCDCDYQKRKRASGLSSAAGSMPPLFAAKFFAQPVSGQVGPQGRGILFYAPNKTAAIRETKAYAKRKGWRWLECYKIDPQERHDHELGGWVFDAGFCSFSANQIEETSTYE
jgi:hypothetical protein